MIVFHQKKGYKNYPNSRGVTLVEMLVGAALFLVIATGIYGAFQSVLTVISASRAKIVAMDLANERFELIRNLPYEDVGISGSIPNGLLPHVETFVRSGFTFQATTTIRNIDDPFDGTIGGSPNDLSPADSRLVEIEIGCATCKNFAPVFVNSRVGPKNLETSSTNGALFIRVFDANGQPVPDADVRIVNSAAVPAILIEDTTNINGMLQIVDAPPGVNQYQITVSKSGYTTDRTYTPGASGNPNPTKPHATVVIQQVTQISFVIDRVSTMNFSSTNVSCTPIGGIDFNLTGSKLIGTGPDVYKYNQDKITDGSGELTVTNMEWDTYPITLIDGTYDLIGTNPLLPVSLLQNTTQDIDFIVATKNPRTLLVAVKDSATGLPLENASVQLQKSGYDTTLVTERGFVSQTDWAGGGGQGTSTDSTRYLSSSGIAVNNPSGEIKLNGSFGFYDASGNLESSTFDVGSPSNFHQLLWLPGDQPADVGAQSVKMQIASNNDTVTWDFVGPDGTSGSYYTSPISDISTVHNGDQFLRYKMYLSTASTTLTPNISDISMTFSSLCVPPGQVAFSGLSSGAYTLSITLAGYQTYSASVNISAPWQLESISLLPQ